MTIQKFIRDTLVGIITVSFQKMLKVCKTEIIWQKQYVHQMDQFKRKMVNNLLLPFFVIPKQWSGKKAQLFQVDIRATWAVMVKQKVKYSVLQFNPRTFCGFHKYFIQVNNKNKLL